MVLRLLLLALLSPVLFVTSAVAWFPAVAWHAVVPPTASGLMAYRVAEAAATGARLRPRHEWVQIESMPVSLLRSILVAEDTRFYEHHGFDVEQIRKAWRSNRRGGALRGASTITQQTAKNLYLSPSRNVLRKGREALLAAWMELCQSKDRILESYLNVVELGPGIFGVGAASGVYFDHAPADLSREQSALLAATLPAPLLRNPGAPSAALRGRQRMILSRMGRWYEGPSLAEEEATFDSVPDEAPVVIPAEPLELEVPPTDGTAEPQAVVESLPEESRPGANPAPGDEAPPPDSP